MLRFRFVLIASAVATASASGQTHRDVNPFIGTGGHGHTYPGATTPFGMVQLSPDSRFDGWDGCGGYHFTDDRIYGFSHTHLQGTGVSDYGDVLFAPCTQFLPGKTDWKDRAGSAVDKNSERAWAGYYGVDLVDQRLTAELTATPRVGIHRYTLAERDTFTLVINLAYRDELVEYSIYPLDDSTLVGHRISKAWAEEQHVYFAARFSSPFTWRDQLEETVDIGFSPDGTRLQELRYVPVFAADFGVIDGLTARVAISGVDTNGALMNLLSEAPHGDFDRYRAAAEALWDDALARITVEGGTETERRIFATSLYHCMTTPNLASDVDGRYRGGDLAVHSLAPGDGNHYSVFSLWDTFRALHPLLNWIEPERSRDFVRTMLRFADESGGLPVWELAGNETGCMIGYHSVPVIADAHAWGIRGFDGKRALQWMVQAADSAHLGLPAYAKFGYIPSEVEPESVSKTLEYAFDDACISWYATDVGATDVAERFRLRALNYRNLMHPTSGFFQPRRGGAWVEDFDPCEVNFNFTEANGWQYGCFVPHDAAGFARLLGGPEALGVRLDSLFFTTATVRGRHQADITGLIGQYAHGNEPSHHAAFMYAFSDRPERMVPLVQQIRRDLYADAPDGLSGNEDCGQMSAWYVWTALGLYPLAPGAGQAVVAFPAFDRITVRPRSGTPLDIARSGSGAHITYRLNSQGSNSSHFVSYPSLTTSQSMMFEAQTRPASSPSEVHHRTMAMKPWDDQNFAAAPGLDAPRTYRGRSVDVTVSHLEPDARLELALGPDGRWKSIRPGVHSLAHSGELRVRATLPSGASHEIRHTVRRMEHTVSASYPGPTYDHQYTAGGDQALVDGLFGSTEFRTGEWQGFPGRPCDVVLDLGRTEDLSGVRLGALHDTRPWIFLPRSVEVWTSADGVAWTPAGKAGHDVPAEQPGSQVLRIEVPFRARARYVRVVAEPFGPLPDWHLSAGEPAWLFVDEIEVLR